MNYLVEKQLKQIANEHSNWRYEDLKYIYQQHNNVTVKNMADHLFLSIASVRSMLKAMGLAEYKRNKVYINATLDLDLVNTITKMANEQQITRSELIEKLLKSKVCQSGTTPSASAK